MCPITVCICWPHIPPGEGIQTCDIGASSLAKATICLVPKLQGVCWTSAANIINRDQDRDGEKSQRYEDNEERLEIAKEKVGVEAALVYDFSILELKYRKYPYPIC